MEAKFRPVLSGPAQAQRPRTQRASIDLKLLQLVPALVAVLLLTLVVVATERMVADELSRRALFRVEQVASTYADQIARVLSRRASELTLLSRSAALQSDGASMADRRAEMQRLKDSSPNYVWIGWIGADGTVLASTDRLLEGQNIAQRPVFRNGQAGLWFGSLHPPVALKPEMERRGLSVPHELADLALPIHGADGALRAVLAAHINGQTFEALRQRVLGPEAARRGLVLALLGPDGNPLLGESPAFVSGVPRLAHLSPTPTSWVEDDDLGRSYARSQHVVETIDSPLKLDWEVAAAQPMQTALAPARELQRYLYLGGGLAALLIGGFGVWVSRRLAAPYARVFDALAERVEPRPDIRPAAYLDAVLDQIQRQPMPVRDESPGGTLLLQVLNDAERIKTVLDLLPAPVYFIDADNRLVYWNHSAAEIFGWQSQSLAGRRVLDVIKWVGPWEMKRALMKRLAEEPGPWTFELEVERLDGVRIGGEWRVSKVVGPDGKDAGLICKVRDHTGEQEARQRLQEQTETLSAIIQASSDAVISTDESGRIELFNPAAERIFGRDANDVIGTTLEVLLPQRHRAEHGGHLRRFSESSTTRRRMGAGLVKGLRADGTELELEASISQVTVRSRKVLTAILRDVTERVKAERQKMRYQLELSDLTHRMMDQEKETTRRLAQILHDRLGQTITALRLSVDALSSGLSDRLDPAVHDRLGKIDGLVQLAVDEVRQALVELRPPFLEEAGLASALENECRIRTPEMVPAQLTLQIEPEVRSQRWPADVEYAAFMVAREAVLNALHHASALHIDVALGGDAGRVILDVTDDGVGLPKDMGFGRPGHLGMVGMRERAIAIGARLSVLPGPQGGTLIRLEWEESE